MVFSNPKESHEEKSPLTPLWEFGCLSRSGSGRLSMPFLDELQAWCWVAPTSALPCLALRVRVGLLGSGITHPPGTLLPPLRGTYPGPHSSGFVIVPSKAAPSAASPRKIIVVRSCYLRRSLT